MTAIPWSQVEALCGSHDISTFTTGLPSVDDWFESKALPEQNAGRVRTHLCLSPDGDIVAFYALKLIVVNVEGGSRKIRDTAEAGGSATGLLLAQMGVREDLHGRGAGSNVVRQVMKEASEQHHRASFRLLVVDAENPTLVPYYERFGFSQLAGDLRMVMKMSAVNKIVAQLQ